MSPSGFLHALVPYHPMAECRLSLAAILSPHRRAEQAGASCTPTHRGLGDATPISTCSQLASMRYIWQRHGEHGMRRTRQSNLLVRRPGGDPLSLCLNKYLSLVMRMEDDGGYDTSLQIQCSAVFICRSQAYCVLRPRWSHSGRRPGVPGSYDTRFL